MTKPEIGQKLENRRKSLGITQAQLSEHVGLSVMTIVNIETGKGNPTLDVLIRVLDVLGLQFEITATKADK